MAGDVACPEYIATLAWQTLLPTTLVVHCHVVLFGTYS